MVLEFCKNSESRQNFGTSLLELHTEGRETGRTFFLIPQSFGSRAPRVPNCNLSGQQEQAPGVPRTSQGGRTGGWKSLAIGSHSVQGHKEDVCPQTVRPGATQLTLPCT